jgi:hypothetical protein
MFDKLQSQIAAKSTDSLRALARAAAVNPQPSAAVVLVAINCELRKRNEQQVAWA